MDGAIWIGCQDISFHPAVSAFPVAEHGAHQVFDQWPVPAQAFPFTGGNGEGSGAPHIGDPRSTSATHQYDLHGNENAPLCTQSGSPSPFWIPSAINAQSEWCSERHTQQVFDVMSTLQGRVLLVRILHAMYPVTLDMLNHVFSLYGSVEKIVRTSPLHGHQVLIQYQQHQMASLALRVLQGHSLYQSCCYLEVKYALGSELQVLYPSSSVDNMFAGGNTYKEHDDFALSNERVIEQPPPMQLLDEVPSAYDPQVAVQLCSSEVVQEAAMVRQGNPASSPPLVVHVDGMEMPMSVQDASDLFEEMPVYDVYEEDTNASPHGVVELSDTVGQHSQYDNEKPDATKLWESDNELLAVCFDDASDNAFSEEATGFSFPHGPVTHADMSRKLTNEKIAQAASLPCVQQETMHCDDARSGINRKKQYVLITMHAITYPYDLNNDKEVQFTLQYQLPLNSTPCIWDPGIDLFSHKKLYIFSWIPYSAIIIPQQEHFFFVEKGTQVPWDPGIELLLYEILWLKTVSKETEYALRHLSEMICTISEQWSFKYNAMHYCEIFQRCTTMSSQFHCQGIPFWLIHFQPP